MTYSKNAYLTRPEMTVNAQYLMGAFTSRGWTKNAVAGMLGNMETESTINPGIWQNLDEGNMRMGYGLVQWTPATNYIDWASARGYDRKDVDGQIARIIFELENGLQWISTSSYPLTFKQFSQSTESPEYLAQAFLRNYERPANQNQPNRSTQARYWFDAIEGTGGGKPVFPTTEGLTVSSEYGMRFHPIENIWKFHYGIDIGGGGVTHPIYATQTGEVIYNDWTDWGGWGIRIKHTVDPYYSMYIHLHEKSPIPVGAKVTKGDRIGTMGNTGASAGIHLHFEIMLYPTGYSTEDGTMDPLLYLAMDFGGGDNGGGDSRKDRQKDIVKLLLSDQLNGWKY